MISMNPAQLEAVHTIEGPVIIISCPGSGKTTTLIHRVRFMIECRIDPASILTVTFTNAAAARMKHYYQKVFGREDALQFLTIHSLCFGILRREGLYGPGDILKEEERRRFVYQQVSRMTWVNDPWELTGALLTDFSVVRNNDIDPDAYEPEACPARTFREVLRSYDEYRDRNHKIDFDDMLIQCRELLRDPEILSRWQKRFQYIQCDEYQDTNGLQRDILYMLAGEKKNLCVVGDDDQSIYMFRGARPEIMLRFEKDFPGCRIIHLSTNYRSGQAIVDRAGLVIAHNRARYQKDFLSDRGQKGAAGKVLCQSFEGRSDEMDYVVTCIRDAARKGVPYREMAVLFRTGRQAQLPAAALMKAGIPAFSTESVRSIYDGWVFEGIRTYVKLSLGQAGPDAMLYVLNRPSRYLKEEYFKDCSYSLSSMLRAASYLKREAYWKYEAARESLTDWMKAFGPAVLRPTDEPYLVFQALKSERLRCLYPVLCRIQKAGPGGASGRFRPDGSRCQDLSDHPGLAGFCRGLRGRRQVLGPAQGSSGGGPDHHAQGQGPGVALRFSDRCEQGPGPPQECPDACGDRRGEKAFLCGHDQGQRLSLYPGERKEILLYAGDGG